MSMRIPTMCMLIIMMINPMIMIISARRPRN